MEINPAAQIVRLQALMNDYVGPLRTRTGLEHALNSIREIETMCDEPWTPRAAFDAEWLDLHDLANLRLIAECVTRAALERTESRGAHQREDFAHTETAWQRHQVLRLAANGLRIES